jgi:hypothetical protein
MRDKIVKALSEAVNVKSIGLSVMNENQFNGLNENILAKMFESIGQKYNEIDFSEIEKSKGSFSKFKYNNLIFQNMQMLDDLYMNNTDPSVVAMAKYTSACRNVGSGLLNNEARFVAMYDNPVVAVLYNTSVATLIYTTTLLLSTTVRFVTIDKDADIEVIIDNLPNAEKNIFLGNIVKLAAAYENDIPKFLNEMEKATKKTISETAVIDNDPMVVNEAAITVPLFILAIPAAMFALTKIIPLIRELIYGMYHIRVSIENALDYQIDLISANIEILEDRNLTTPKEKRKYKRVIARQRKIVEKLDKIKKAVSIKFDVAENQAKKEIVKANREISSEYNLKSNYSNDLMI